MKAEKLLSYEKLFLKHFQSGPTGKIDVHAGLELFLCQMRGHGHKTIFGYIMSVLISKLKLKI